MSAVAAKRSVPPVLCCAAALVLAPVAATEVGALAGAAGLAAAGVGAAVGAETCGATPHAASSAPLALMATRRRADRRERFEPVIYEVIYPPMFSGIVLPGARD